MMHVNGRYDVTECQKRNMTERPCVTSHHRKRSLDTMGALYEDVEKFFGDIFALYGRAVVMQPLPFVLLPLLVCASLGFGLLRAEHETSAQALYTPVDGASARDYDTLSSLFGSHSSDRFAAYQQLNNGHFLEIIVTLPDNATHCANISDNDVIPRDIQEMIDLVVDSIVRRNVSIGGKHVTYDDVCALQNGSCVINGVDSIFNLLQQRHCSKSRALLEKLSLLLYNNGSNYYDWTRKANTRSVWLRFNLRHHDLAAAATAAWQDAISDALRSLKTQSVTLTFRTSTSLDAAIARSSRADAHLFVYSVVITSLYAVLIGAGRNWVSNHVVLALTGVLATVLSMVAAAGVVSWCGVPFVNMSGLVPFLILGTSVGRCYTCVYHQHHVQQYQH